MVTMVCYKYHKWWYIPNIKYPGDGYHMITMVLWKWYNNGITPYDMNIIKIYHMIIYKWNIINNWHMIYSIWYIITMEYYKWYHPTHRRRKFGDSACPTKRKSSAKRSGSSTPYLDEKCWAFTNESRAGDGGFLVTNSNY